MKKRRKKRKKIPITNNSALYTLHWVKLLKATNLFFDRPVGRWYFCMLVQKLISPPTTPS